jgi:hypothetical protein
VALPPYSMIGEVDPLGDTRVPQGRGKDPSTQRDATCSVPNRVGAKPIRGETVSGRNRFGAKPFGAKRSGRNGSGRNGRGETVSGRNGVGAKRFRGETVSGRNGFGAKPTGAKRFRGESVLPLLVPTCSHHPNLSRSPGPP